MVTKDAKTKSQDEFQGLSQGVTYYLKSQWKGDTISN